MSQVVTVEVTPAGEIWWGLFRVGGKEMIVAKECDNAIRVMDDLPPDVRAVLSLFDDSHMLFASHSFIDFIRVGDGKETGLFRTSIGTGYDSALRKLTIWVREGMPERHHD